MEYEVIFDLHFFKALADKWLNTREIYLLLTNIEELLSSHLITLSNEMTKEPSNGDYYVIDRSNINPWKVEYNKQTKTELKVSGIPMIKCHYSISTSLNLQRRIYYLTKKPKYAFIHYRQVEHKERKRNTLPYTLIKILTFSPEYILENCLNVKMLIVIETTLSYNYLLSNVNKLAIGFGPIKVPVSVISLNVLECTIPPQKTSEVIVDIFFDNQKISFYNTFKSFQYIPSNNLNSNINLFSFFNQSNIYCKEQCPIFSLTEENIIERIISIVNHLKLEIGFVRTSLSTNSTTANQNDIDISQLESDFDEENLNTVISKLYNELNNISKHHLLNAVDQYGHNLLHYVCCLNLSFTLQLLNYYKINFEIKSNDNLTAYEICAGKRNLACLEQLITIIDNHDVIEDNECFDGKEKCLYNRDVLRSALNLSLEKKKIDLDDIKVLDLLIKQIKIKYTVDSTSGNICEHIDNKTFHPLLSSEENKSNKGDNIQIIQKSVRGWLRRNKYKQLKKTTKHLIEKIKTFSERQRFLNKKQSTIFIQKKIRKWLTEKHTTNRKCKNGNSSNNNK